MKDNLDFYTASKFDVIIIVLVFFLSGVSIIWVTRKHLKQSSQPKVALVYQKNNLLEEIKLDKDGVIPLLNGKMRIEAKRGRIRVLSSDCPQHICVNTGWIQYSGQSIVCVPNRVLIEVKARGPSVIDAVAY